MLTSLLAFFFECFGKDDGTETFLAAAGWIAVAVLVGWTIFTGWESGESSRLVSDILKDLLARALPSQEAEDREGEAEGAVAEGANSTNGAGATDQKANTAERKWWSRVLLQKREVFSHRNGATGRLFQYLMVAFCVLFLLYCGCTECDSATEVE